MSRAENNTHRPLSGPPTSEGFYDSRQKNDSENPTTGKVARRDPSQLPEISTQVRFPAGTPMSMGNTKSPLVNLAYNKSTGWNTNALQRIAAVGNQTDKKVALEVLQSMATQKPEPVKVSEVEAKKGKKAEKPLAQDQRGSAVSALGNLARGDSSSAAQAYGTLDRLSKKGNPGRAYAEMHGPKPEGTKPGKKWTGGGVVAWNKSKPVDDPSKTKYTVLTTVKKGPNKGKEMLVRTDKPHQFDRSGVSWETQYKRLAADRLIASLPADKIHETMNDGEIFGRVGSSALTVEQLKLDEARLAAHKRAGTVQKSDASAPKTGTGSELPVGFEGEYAQYLKDVPPSVSTPTRKPASGHTQTAQADTRPAVVRNYERVQARYLGIQKRLEGMSGDHPDFNRLHDQSADLDARSGKLWGEVKAKNLEGLVKAKYRG